MSAASSYAWRARPESPRSIQARTLLSAIRVVDQESKPTGVPASGPPWSNRATTPSNHRLPVAENTLNRQFLGTQPTRVWAGDLTSVWTTEGWLYLAVILDLDSHLMVG